MADGPPPTPDGHALDEAASSLQKSLRRSDEEAAVYWALQLAQRTPHYAWYRLKTVVSEDVGLAGDVALPATIQTLHTWYDEARQRKGGDGNVHLAHAAMLVARSRKSRAVTHCMLLVENGPLRQPPDHALDMYTARGRAMGRGIEHFRAESGWLVDPDTGELSPEGSIPDPYRERWINEEKKR